MPSDAVSEAVDLLVLRRGELQSEAAAISVEIKRIDHALGALKGDVVAPSATEQGPSVRTLLVRLLEEDARDWSAGEVLAEYSRRGTPVHGKDPDNALRAAIADANKRGLIVRTAPGRYAAKVHENSFAVSDTPSGLAHLFKGEVRVS
jgi:hypothetical protein